MKKIEEIKNCKNCELYKNQAPLLSNGQTCDVMVVGLSAKLIKFKDEKPLDKTTLSGALIEELEKASSNLTFYKTNLVKCVPLNKSGKLTYPNKRHCNACLSNLKAEINELKPKTVLLLGKKVSGFVEAEYGVKFNTIKNFNYKTKSVEGINFLAVHHPSYISVYKRNESQEYINKITKQIN